METNKNCHVVFFRSTLFHYCKFTIFFKLNIFFQTYKLIIYFFFFLQKKFRHKCIVPQCGKIAIQSLGCVSACTYCFEHSEWYVKESHHPSCTFFFLFFFLFVFRFFDNWECWNLLRLRFITTQTCLILQKKGLRRSVYVGLR